MRTPKLSWQEAARLPGPVLLIFGFAGCEPCRRLKRALPRLRRVLNHTTILYTPVKEGDEADRHWHVLWYAPLAVLIVDGRPVARYQGYDTYRAFHAWVIDALTRKFLKGLSSRIGPVKPILLGQPARKRRRKQPS